MTQTLKVGHFKSENKKIAKPLVKLIISFQRELQENENKKKNPKRISFVYASLVLSRRFK